MKRTLAATIEAIRYINACSPMLVENDKEGGLRAYCCLCGKKIPKGQRTKEHAAYPKWLVKITDPDGRPDRLGRIPVADLERNAPGLHPKMEMRPYDKNHLNACNACNSYSDLVIERPAAKALRRLLNDATLTKSSAHALLIWLEKIRAGLSAETIFRGKDPAYPTIRSFRTLFGDLSSGTHYLVIADSDSRDDPRGRPYKMVRSLGASPFYDAVFPAILSCHINGMLLISISDYFRSAHRSFRGRFRESHGVFDELSRDEETLLSLLRRHIPSSIVIKREWFAEEQREGHLLWANSVNPEGFVPDHGKYIDSLAVSFPGRHWEPFWSASNDCTGWWDFRPFRSFVEVPSSTMTLDDIDYLQFSAACAARRVIEKRFARDCLPHISEDIQEVCTMYHKLRMNSATRRSKAVTRESFSKSASESMLPRRLYRRKNP